MKKTLDIIKHKVLTGVLTGILAVSALSTPTKAEVEGTSGEGTSETAEIRAVFDRGFYEAGDTVQVEILIQGVSFDMAGFHLSYDTAVLEECGLTMGAGLYNAAGSQWETGTVEVLATSSGTLDSTEGMTLASLSFRAVTAGAPALEFTPGSQLYLEGKSSVVYCGSTELPVRTKVVVDAEAENTLQACKDQAKADLEEYVNPLLEQTDGVKQERLLQALQQGKQAIDEAADAGGVEQSLMEAKARIEEVMAQELTVPRLELLSDSSSFADGGPADLYPVFSPDQHEYYLYNNRPINGVARKFYGKTGTGVTVTMNGSAVSVKSDGTFSFDVPFQAVENANRLVLTNEAAGLSAVYTFYSFGYGVTNRSKSYWLTDSLGQQDSARISAFDHRNSVYVASSYVQKVKFHHQASVPANSVYRAELMKSDGTILETYHVAAGETSETFEFLSCELDLQPGLNQYLLRCYGTYNEFVNGQAIQQQGCNTNALLIYYVEQTEDEGLADAELSEIKVCIGPDENRNYFEGLREGIYAYDITLPAEDFNWAEDERQVYLLLGEKEGQTIAVSSNSSTVARPACQKQENGFYEVYEFKATDCSRELGFTAAISVTARDGITKNTYILKVTKTGKADISIPEIYRDREYTISATQPERKINMAMGSIVLTDQSGSQIPTARAMADGTLSIEIEDTGVLVLDEAEPVYGGSYVIRLVDVGRTAIHLIFRTDGQEIRDTVYVSANYSVGCMKVEMEEGNRLLQEEKTGDRIYAEGAAEILKEAIAETQKVYSTYASVSRNQMTEEQKQEINRAVEKMAAANESFRRSEIGKKITAFDDLSPSVLIQQVDNDTKLEELALPESLGATIDGSHVVISGVTWRSTPAYEEKREEECRYTFTAVLPAGYVAMEGVPMPQIRVDRGEVKFVFPVNSSLPLDADVAVQRVPLGTPREELKLPNLQTYVRPDLAAGLIDIPTIWLDVDGYDGNTIGTYTFQSALDPSRDDFKLGANIKANTFRKITVIVYEPENGGGSETGGDEGGSGTGEGGTGTGEGEGGSGTGTGEGETGEDGSGTGDAGKPEGTENTEENKGSGENQGEASAEEKQAEKNMFLQNLQPNKEEQPGNLLTDLQEVLEKTESRELAAEEAMAEMLPESAEAAEGGGSGENGNIPENEAKTRKVYSIISRGVGKHPAAAILAVSAAAILLLLGVWMGIRRKRRE